MYEKFSTAPQTLVCSDPGTRGFPFRSIQARTLGSYGRTSTQASGNPGQDSWRVRLAMARLRVEAANGSGVMPVSFTCLTSASAATRTFPSRISTTLRSQTFSPGFLQNRGWMAIDERKRKHEPDHMRQDFLVMRPHNPFCQIQ